MRNDIIILNVNGLNLFLSFNLQQCSECRKLSTHGPNDGFVDFKRISTVCIHENNDNSSAGADEQWHDRIKTIGQINGQHTIGDSRQQHQQ